MFSKALFKQSMKANWVKWVMATASTCIMLAIVIIVLGNLGINNIRDQLKEVFTQADQQTYLKTNAIDSYDLYLNAVDFENGVIMLSDSGMATVLWGFVTSNYDSAEQTFKQENPDITELSESDYEIIRNNAVDSTYTQIVGLIEMFPQYAENFNFEEDELKQLLYFLMLTYEDNKDLTGDTATSENIISALKERFGNYVYDNAYATALTQEDATEETALASAMSARELASDAFACYDQQKSQAEVDGGTFVYDNDNFKTLANDYVNDMFYQQALLSFGTDGELSEEEQTEAEQMALAAKVMSNTAITTYEFWIQELTTDEEGLPLELTDEEYSDALSKAREEATKSITGQIDAEVSNALEELGNMDIYSLIIGSIFYRIAGLLMPMVFVIMTANGLLAGQVDSGSMAYVLSTPTKRRTVTLTQMTYLIVSLFAMFALLTVTSVIAVWISGGNAFAINYSQILLFNLGAFLTMFAIAGFCFMCSAIFNRTKYSLGIGGGVTIFSLVCTILGLFGSSVVPSAMRIGAMDFFNYLSIISLYDTVSIMAGSLAYLWKFAILLGIGIVCFIIGIFRFDKKDLPL